MSSVNEGAPLELLLHQLYLKKQWLDTMITGLESAVGSADHQFIESVTQLLGDRSEAGPTVDLRPPVRTRLARLANQVRKNGVGRRDSVDGAAL